MKLYRLDSGPVVFTGGEYIAVPETWDALIASDALGDRLRELAASGSRIAAPPATELRAPIGTQEVWAAGVTYYRSRDARMEEAEAAGGGNFYDRVYSAARPELFFKAPPYRVVGPGECVRIRGDSRWNVPEPELTVALSARGEIVGYTIGNDMSSRDIEGENPLYLPQAKTYDGSCALGPCLLVEDGELPPNTAISLHIRRGDDVAFAGETSLEELKRRPRDLASWLFRETSFPHGCLLMTGTGIVPPSDFSLASGDRIEIAIEGIGVLENPVA